MPTLGQILAKLLNARESMHVRREPVINEIQQSLVDSFQPCHAMQRKGGAIP